AVWVAPGDHEAIEHARLRSIFSIHTQCDSCKDWVGATGFSQDGVWIRTTLGDIWVARLEPAFPDEPPRCRRRCGHCDRVWGCPGEPRLADCPGCGMPTRLEGE